MRWLSVAAVVAALLCGCARTVDGAAAAPNTNPTETVLRSADGFGIQLGKPTARVALDIFIDPRCSLCARLEMFQGGEIADDIDSGDLVVTYRFVTSDAAPTGYSHRVSNAVFLAADADLPAVAVQAFVQQLYWDADPSRDNRYLADIAASARLPQPVVDRIASGSATVDTAAMNVANRKRLNDIRVDTVPTVYDRRIHATVDTADNDWLKRLTGGR
ncbi:MAG: DsbA family protein [Candidatus Sericytochromatia bacterium]